jgi:site-specific recombinase XerC
VWGSKAAQKLHQFLSFTPTAQRYGSLVTTSCEEDGTVRLHLVILMARHDPRRLRDRVGEPGCNTRWAMYAWAANLATTLLDRGMPLEQIQKFLGHAKLETTQMYAETSTERIKESYQRALGG